jgi:protein-disulfide isomerase
MTFAGRALRLLIPALFALLVACAVDHPTATPVSPAPTSAPSAQLGPAQILQANSGKAPPIADQSGAAIPVTAADPQRGRADALVTIVEFSDFQCPFCARVNPTLDKIRENYGESVRFVWKHEPLPFHTNARKTHDASVAVFELGASSAFWRFHDEAFKNQNALDAEHFEAWAVLAGVNREAFRGRVHADEPKVDTDIALARRVGATGTPAFFVNGIKITGAQPFEAFKEVIDAELLQAQALAKQGIPLAEIYVRRANGNFKAPPIQPTIERTAEVEDTRPWQVPVLTDDPVDGPADALVTIVQFSDFQCPFCKRVEATLDEVRKQYKGDVRIVWKDNPLPFHPRALPAAVLGRMAFQQRGSKGFWSVHHALFESQPKLEDEDLTRVAAQNGLSWSAATAPAQTSRQRSKIDASVEFATDVQARGTPHFFINGVRLSGAQPLDQFQKVIDAELAKAKALVASGTPRAKLYSTLQKDALTPPPPERKEVEVPVASPFRGPAAAKVVIQEFADFQCPFCNRVEPTLVELEKAFPGQIKIVWRHLPLPFHKDAQPAAEAAEEVRAQLGNKGFWAYHDQLLASQSLEGGLSEERLLAVAKEVGADVDKVQSALKQGTHRARIQADLDASKAAEINGTPAFVINGYFLSGAQPLVAFKKVVNLALHAPGSAKPGISGRPR